VLDEVELLVRCGDPEVRTVIDQCLLVGVALFVDHGDRRLLAERRIGQHDIGVLVGFVAKRVLGLDRRLAIVVIGSDRAQEQVHGT